MKKVLIALLALSVNFSANANEDDGPKVVPTKATCNQDVKEDGYSVGIVYDSSKNIDYAFVVKKNFKRAFTQLVYVTPVTGKRVDNDTNLYSNESGDFTLSIKSNPEESTAILNAASENIQSMPLSCQTNSSISFDKIKWF